MSVRTHPRCSRTRPAPYFVALSETDQVAIVDTRTRAVRYLNDAAPGAPLGMTPNALALSRDESKLFVAEAGNNAIAVFDISAERAGRSSGNTTNVLLGRLPTDWYPTDVIDNGRDLLILNAKGHGSGPNPDGPLPAQPITRPYGYALGELTRHASRHVGISRALRNYLNGSRRVSVAGAVTRAPCHGTIRRSSTWSTSSRRIARTIRSSATCRQVLGDGD